MIRRLAPVLAVGVAFAACGGRSLPPGASAEARAAYEACRDFDWEEKQACYEARLIEELDQDGVGAALEMLEAIADADVNVEVLGHVFTHAIGIEAYSPDTPFADVFSECTVLFQSGCYHGVVQAHFLDTGTPDADRIVELCAPYEGDDADRWILFQCLHGLGHGLTMYHGHNLPMALEGCDFLTNPWNRESCYGGAFMENVVNATHPHHPAAALVSGAAEGGGEGQEAEAGHGAHDHSDGMSDGVEPWDALRADDPHYPCSVLDDQYLNACYMMQTSGMLWHNEGDIADAAASCLQAREGWQGHCFLSLGRDISARTLQDEDDGLRECGKSPEEFREWCYVGLVKNFVDLTATTGAAFGFCRRVEPWAKDRCYQAVGEQIIALHADAEGRREECSGAESEEFARVCQRGAQVPIE
ncbi:hypothetical protein [Candidatus Palauibacter sp.]|uniref:hypothetical protein n=1 Tax=Candidatus Palauibacter sp. TaxID=3101350 RepID=UPI003AF2DB4F